MSAEATNEELLFKIAELEKENKDLKTSKKFGLVFENSLDEKVKQIRSSIPVLEYDSSKAIIPQKRESSENFLISPDIPVSKGDEANHILINGDNFQALTALRATHKNSIQIIYIDPPYNTGNKDFIYNDNYMNNEDGYRHSKWLSFMEKRLRLAHELLSEDGVIFISIDDNEQARLKILMDEIFGEENFMSNFIRNTSSGEKTSKININESYEYTIVFAKSITALPVNFAKQLRNNDDFTNPDSDPNGPWKKDSIEIKIDAGRFGHARYPIYNPYLEETYYPPVHYNEKNRKQWHYIEDTFNEKIKDGAVVFCQTQAEKGKSKYGFFIKNYLRGRELFTNISNLAFNNSLYSNSRGTNELSSIFDTKVFSYPKPSVFVKDLIRLYPNKSATILDFFAGSGTTGHAVAELNKEDGGFRKFILVTDEGKTETVGESSKNSNDENVNIADDVCYERLRKVLTGEDWADGKDHEPLGGNLQYFKLKLVDGVNEKSNTELETNTSKYSISSALLQYDTFDNILNHSTDEEIWKIFRNKDEKTYLAQIIEHDFDAEYLKTYIDEILSKNSENESFKIVLVGDDVESIEWLEDLTIEHPNGMIVIENLEKKLINQQKFVSHHIIDQNLGR